MKNEYAIAEPIYEGRYRRLTRALRTITRLMIALVIVAPLVLLQLESSVQAQSTQSQVSVEAIPAIVDVPYEGEARAQIAVRNPTNATLMGVQLSWFTNAGVKINDAPVNCDAAPQTSSQPLTIDSIAPGGDYTWELKIARCGQKAISGTVQLHVAYTAQVQGNPASAQRVIFGSMQVKNRDLDSIEQLVDIQVQTSLSALNEYRPGTIYIVIKNKSNEDLQVKSVKPRGHPTFIRIEAAETEQPFTLKSRDTASFVFGISATNEVRPGKHLLVFETTLGRGTQGNEQTATLINTREIEVGVLGEAEILTVLAIPTFLLLPGFLIMVTLGVLSSRFAGNTNVWGPKDHQFWAAIVVLSSVMGLVGYPLITSIPGVSWVTGGPRNYLQWYGLIDIAWVSTLSIILASIGYSVWRGIPAARRWWNKRRLIPARDDKPIDVLRKLVRQEDWDVHHVRIKARIGTKDLEVFPLQPLGAGKQELWVGPSMRVTWRAGSDPGLVNEAEPTFQQGGNLRDLLRVLESQLKKNKNAINIDWMPIDGLNKPRNITIETVEMAPNAFIITSVTSVT
jgi:hypothetical protein